MDLPPEILVEIFGYLISDHIEDLDSLLCAIPSLIQYIHLYNWRTLVQQRFPDHGDLELYRGIIPSINTWYRLYRMLYEYHYRPSIFINRLHDNDIGVNQVLLNVLKSSHPSRHHKIIKLFTVDIPRFGKSIFIYSKILKIGMDKYVKTLYDIGYNTITKVIDNGFFIDTDIYIACITFIYNILPNLIHNNKDHDDHDTQIIRQVVCDRLPSIIKYGIMYTSRTYHNIISNIFSDVDMRYTNYICLLLLEGGSKDFNTKYYRYRFIFECEYGRRCLICKLRNLVSSQHQRNMIAFYINKLNLKIGEIMDIFMTNRFDNVTLFISLCGGRLYRLNEYKTELSRRRLLTDRLTRRIKNIRRII
jgi:hypothetical protein